MVDRHHHGIDALGSHDEVADVALRARSIVAEVAEVQPTHGHEAPFDSLDGVADDLEVDDLHLVTSSS